MLLILVTTHSLYVVFHFPLPPSAAFMLCVCQHVVFCSQLPRPLLFRFDFLFVVCVVFVLSFVFRFLSIQPDSLSEALDLSGILAVFFCGLTLSHYAWHSLGENAQVCFVRACVHRMRVFALIANAVLIFAPHPSTTLCWSEWQRRFRLSSLGYTQAN